MFKDSRQFDPAKPEMMDVEQPVSGALRRDLANLETLNRIFGSHALIRHFLSKWVHGGKSWRILDLATGGGDIPREIIRWCRHRHIDVRIDAVDRQAATIEIAEAESRNFPEVAFHVSDILDFTLPGPPWDIVICSLALHHFSESDAVQILKSMSGMTCGRALAADLRRSLLGTIGVECLTAVWMREPMTRHDARASVRRAFSEPELGALAKAAGWDPFAQRRFPVSRQAIWLEV